MTPDEAAITAWFASRADRTIETAIARVFLTGRQAFKLKRHVSLGYVDFSTPEKRLWALDRELAFNQAGAPGIYRAVRRLTRTADGFELDGPGEIADYALEMRRFDETAVLAANPASLSMDLADGVGRAVAGFHARADLRPQGGLRSMTFTVNSNARLCAEAADRLGEDRVKEMIALTAAAFEAQAPLLEKRTTQGFSRLCHGDLHLGNILLEDGRPVLFDCIEFNDLLSDIDVLYDLAFLLMDLQFRGRDEAATRALSAYLDEAARHFPTDALLEGLAALPFMLSVRAGVRAHVSAHSGDDETGRAYVDAAIAHLSPKPPVLAAVGGLSGSGKTGFGRRIAPHVGPAPGAVVLRTDEVRKRLAGLPAHAAGSAALYTPELYGRAYDALFDEAGAMLRAGRGVVLDATFIDAGLRARAERLAADCGVAFEGVWLDAPEAVLAARIAGRVGDASDATVATLAEQRARDLGPMSWTRVDASGPPEAAVAAWTGHHAL